MPSLGQYIGLQNCSASNASKTQQQWALETTGAFARIPLFGSSNICVGIRWGVALETVACAGAPTWQLDGTSHAIRLAGGKKCLRVSAGNVANIAKCAGKGQTGQEFSYNAQQKTILSNKQCLGVCGAP